MIQKWFHKFIFMGNALFRLDLLPLFPIFGKLFTTGVILLVFRKNFFPFFHESANCKIKWSKFDDSLTQWNSLGTTIDIKYSTSNALWVAKSTWEQNIKKKLQRNALCCDYDNDCRFKVPSGKHFLTQSSTLACPYLTL